MPTYGPSENLSEEDYARQQQMLGQQYGNIKGPRAFTSNIAGRGGGPTQNQMAAAAAPAPSGGVRPSWMRMGMNAARNAVKNAPAPTPAAPVPAAQPLHGVDIKQLQVYQNLLGQATAKGPSPWLNLEMQRINAEQSGMADQATRAASLAQAQGLSSLASSGGLDSGARERMMSANSLGLMNNLQGVSKQGSLARLGAGAMDEQRKLDILKGLAPMESGIHQFNYDQDTKRYIGDQMAKGMLAGGNPGLFGMGGVLGTGIGADKGLFGTGLFNGKGVLGTGIG